MRIVADQRTVYTTLLNQIRPLLMSDIVDKEKARFSLREYLENPGDRVLVLDNVRKDGYAQGFWRLFVQPAIDISLSTEGQQHFLLDEFDKLPVIENLSDLTSAGRTASVVRILLSQDVHQIERRYEELARSLWTNCPNRIAFRPGDKETAELILSSLGETEMRTQSLSESMSKSPDQDDVLQHSQTIEDQRPLLSGDLMDLETGEALIQSEYGWWLTALDEPEL